MIDLTLRMCTPGDRVLLAIEREGWVAGKLVFKF